MINANELRCGNYAMANNIKYRPDDVGKTVFIVGVDSLRNFKDHQSTANIYLLDDVFKDTYGTWLVYLEPIPITEEWLLKFGFERMYLSEFRSKYTHKETHCIGYDFSYVVDKSMEGFTWYGRYVKDIKYIHQLQNLYFSLICEELTLSVI